MPEMRTLAFGDLGQLFDGPHATPTRRSDGPFFLNIASLKSGRLDLSESDHVSDEDFKKWTRRVTPRSGDLLFSYETRLGEAALMPDYIEACLGRRMALLRPNRSIIDPRYLLYFYLSPQFQRTIAKNTIHGATVSRIGLATMPNWKVEILADVGAQQRISDVLSTLDEKIDINNTLIARLDELANLHWVDAIRSGPRVPLSSLAKFVNGKAFTKNASGTGRVVIRIAELNSGLGASTVYNDIQVPDHHLARPGDLLFAWSGSLTVARWFRSEAIINQHIFKVIPLGEGPLWLVAQALRTKLNEFKAIAADKATTMGHIQRRHLDDPVQVPGYDETTRIDALMAGLWNRSLAAERENLMLITTRDELLPLLMSGQLRVREAEKFVEEVV